MSRKIIICSGVLALSGILGGCYVEPYNQAQSPPPAQETVVEAPPAPPPPPAPETPPPPPAPDQEWVSGNYRWNGHSYEMQRGHYERRPHPGARYMPGHWEHRGRGQIWIEAHWG